MLGNQERYAMVLTFRYDQKYSERFYPSSTAQSANTMDPSSEMGMGTNREACS